MKKLYFIILLSLMLKVTSAQTYIGNDWVKVQYQLAAKKGKKANMYVELKDFDPNKHVYHEINLVEIGKVKTDRFLIISTSFNDNGYCYLEMYPNLGTKINAKNKALLLMPNCKIVYTSSMDDGTIDNYAVLRNDSLKENLRVKIGSREGFTNDVTLIIADENVYNLK